MRTPANLMWPSPMTVPSGIAPAGAAAAGAAAFSSAGSRLSGFTRTPSRAALTIPFAISCAVLLGSKRIVHASTSMGRLRPVTTAQVSSCPSSTALDWLKGVPPHRSARMSTWSGSSNEAMASSILARMSSGPMLGMSEHAVMLGWSPNTMPIDCLMPGANSPCVAITIPTNFYLLLLSVFRVPPRKSTYGVLVYANSTHHLDRTHKV